MQSYTHIDCKLLPKPGLRVLAYCVRLLTFSIVKMSFPNSTKTNCVFDNRSLRGTFIGLGYVTLLSHIWE